MSIGIFDFLRASLRYFAPFAVAFLCLGAEPATQPDPAFEKVLESIDHHSGQIADMTASFEQSKFSPLLREPLISRGTIRASGSNMLWDTVVPEATQMLVDGDRIHIFYVKRSVVEEYPVKGNLAALAGSPLPRLDMLRKLFRLVPDAGEGLKPLSGVDKVQAVRLEPIGDLEKYVDHVRVLLDASRGIVLVFELTDPEGERTVIRFDSIKINAGLKPDDFKLKLPENVKVVKPLEQGG